MPRMPCKSTLNNIHSGECHSVSWVLTSLTRLRGMLRGNWKSMINYSCLCSLSPLPRLIRNLSDHSTCTIRNSKCLSKTPKIDWDKVVNQLLLLNPKIEHHSRMASLQTVNSSNLVSQIQLNNPRVVVELTRPVVTRANFHSMCQIVRAAT